MEVKRLKPNFTVTPSPSATGDIILRQPDNIVHKILIHLDLSDLVRTSVLSKSWRYLWIISSQNLIFDSNFFDNQGLKAKREARLLFAERTLGIRTTSCLTLDLMLLDYAQISSLTEITCLDNCIRYAIACDLKRLELRVSPVDGRHYILPPTLFAHRGLVELFLSWCWLKPSSFPSNMSLSCLKVLHFHVAVVDSMKLIEDLIASCPLIEDLYLFFCFAYPVLKFGVINRILKIDGVVNNPKLINITIDQCTFERIEIDAPGLQSLAFAHAFCYKLCAPCDILMASCKNIRSLNLHGQLNNISALTNNMSSKFLHLESMTLSHCSMATIKISSSVLKRLKLVWCKKLIKVEIDDPNLSSFYYVGKNMIYFASNALYLLVGIALQSIPGNVDTLWFIEFVEFLGRFNTAKALTLDVESHKNVIVPRDLRASLLPPLYNVEHLVLQIQDESLTQTIEEVIDALLWFSPHPITLSFASYGKNILELTFLYDEVDGEGKYCACFSSLITCWRHCLKEVKIKNLGMEEDVEKKISYFFEHALSLRKFEDL